MWVGGAGAGVRDSPAQDAFFSSDICYSPLLYCLLIIIMVAICTKLNDYCLFVDKKGKRLVVSFQSFSPSLESVTNNLYEYFVPC